LAVGFQKSRQPGRDRVIAALRPGCSQRGQHRRLQDCRREDLEPVRRLGLGSSAAACCRLSNWPTLVILLGRKTGITPDLWDIISGARRRGGSSKPITINQRQIQDPRPLSPKPRGVASAQRALRGMILADLSAAAAKPRDHRELVISVSHAAVISARDEEGALVRLNVNGRPRLPKIAEHRAPWPSPLLVHRGIELGGLEGTLVSLPTFVGCCAFASPTSGLYPLHLKREIDRPRIDRLAPMDCGCFSRATH